MHNGQDHPKLRLGMTSQQARQSSFRRGIANAPPLPVVKLWASRQRSADPVADANGHSAQDVGSRDHRADAEMGCAAALFWRGHCHHVVQQPIARYLDELEVFGRAAAGRPSAWIYWGDYRLVQVGGMGRASVQVGHATWIAS
jgi:hypothetical protein